MTKGSKLRHEGRHQVPTESAEVFGGMVPPAPQKSMNLFVLDGDVIVHGIRCQDDDVFRQPNAVLPFALDTDPVWRDSPPYAVEVTPQPATRFEFRPNLPSLVRCGDINQPPRHPEQTRWANGIGTGGEGENEQQPFHALTIARFPVVQQPNPLPRFVSQVEP